MTGVKSVIIIPARLASTRLPGKLLLAETGKPLIRHTYEAALRSRLADRVLVACDHPSIYDAVLGFGGEAVMTDPAAPSGTDRVAEAALSIPDADIVVNVQGDEPTLSGDSIDTAIRLLQDRPDAEMATLATPIRTAESVSDPACVKVVFDKTGRALWFSRSVIPYPRRRSESFLTENPPLYYQHIGLYAYRRDFLLSLPKTPQSLCEITEGLEQLRVLHEGKTILVGVIDEAAIGIDTPEDYARFVRSFAAG